VSDIWHVPEQFRGIYAHSRETSAGSRLLFISGQVGVALDGSLAATFDAQLEQAMTNVELLLGQAGMTRTDIVKLSYFVTRREDLAALGEIRRRRWSQSEPPAVTVLVVAGLARPDYLVEIEAIAASR
jgi:enamine deaminase RidA (YjgF/YER057c/UK114 family)